MLARWQPFSDLRSEMNRLQEEMNRLFTRQGLGNGRSAFAAMFPPLNMWEDESHYYVEAELPGMQLEDLEIYVNGGNQLTIKGERRRPTDIQGAWHRQERSYGAFSRAFELPGHVDTDKVEAEFKHGVLRVVLPKHEAARPKRIEVKVES